MARFNADRKQKAAEYSDPFADSAQVQLFSLAGFDKDLREGRRGLKSSARFDEYAVCSSTALCVCAGTLSVHSLLSRRNLKTVCSFVASTQLEVCGGSFGSERGARDLLDQLLNVPAKRRAKPFASAI